MYSFALSCLFMFFSAYCRSHSDLWADIDHEAVYAEGELEKQDRVMPCTLSAQACVIFRLVFVSTIRDHAVYQHAGAHNKLHVVLYSRFDWCCVYLLCVQCTQWSEREGESSKWMPYTYTG